MKESVCGCEPLPEYLATNWNQVSRDLAAQPSHSDRMERASIAAETAHHMSLSGSNEAHAAATKEGAIQGSKSRQGRSN